MSNEVNNKFSFKGLIKRLDYFAVTFAFRVDKYPKYGSVTGGIWFLIFLLFSLLYITIRFFDYISLSNTKILYIEKASNPGPKLNFKDNDFTYAIRLTFDNDSSLVNSEISDLFIIEHNFINRIDEKRIKIKGDLRNCTDKDFFDRSNDYPIFQKNKIQEFSCFDRQDNFTIYGDYNDNEMSYIEVLVSINPKYFQNYSLVEEIFNENQFKFTVYYIDTFNDVSNTAKSVFYKIESVYSYLDLNFYKRYNLDFQQFKFMEDKNLFYNQFQSKSFIKLFEKEENISPIRNRGKSKLEDRRRLNKFFLRAVNNIKIVKVSNQKIPDFLAGLSGLLVNMLVVLRILMTFLNSFEAKQSIMNKIMKYKDDVKLDNKVSLDYLNKKFKDESYYERRNNFLSQIEKEKNINSNFDSFEQEIEIDNEKTINSNFDSIEQNQNEKKNSLFFNKNEEKINEKFREIEKGREKKESFLNIGNDNEKKSSRASHFGIDYLKNNPFSLKISDLFCFIFCCKSNNKNKKIFDNAEKKFNHNIDLVTFMKKMQEIEILKFLLLDRDTLRLMNFISKPCISLSNKEIDDEEYKEFFDINDNVIIMTHKNIDGIKESYDKILKKEKISFTEERILKLFGLHIEEILE
jgi:hypothetical protein